LREVSALLEKAERSFAAADLLLHAGDADFAVSRAYYGWYYVAEALLLSEGLRYSRHGQVISQYGQRFAVTNRLDRRFHRLLGRAFELRQLADYAVEVELEAAGVEDLIAEGEAFVAAAREYLRDRANQE
jgi:uncharacterized protein (UPF0332 family)